MPESMTDYFVATRYPAAGRSIIPQRRWSDKKIVGIAAATAGIILDPSMPARFSGLWWKTIFVHGDDVSILCTVNFLLKPATNLADEGVLHGGG